MMDEVTAMQQVYSERARFYETHQRYPQVAVCGDALYNALYRATNRGTGVYGIEFFGHHALPRNALVLSYEPVQLGVPAYQPSTETVNAFCRAWADYELKHGFQAYHAAVSRTDARHIQRALSGLSDEFRVKLLKITPHECIADGCFFFSALPITRYPEVLS